MMKFKGVAIAIIILVLLGVGSIFLWFQLFRSSPEEGRNGETEWTTLQDLLDGYSIEYPAGSAWDVPSYTNVGSPHSLRISGKGLYEGVYFTMFIKITSDEETEFARTLAGYKDSFGEPQQVAFKEQSATRIGSSKETHYILKRNNAVWDIAHPHFSEPAKKEVAERILNSLRLLSPEQVAGYIEQRDGRKESATEAQIRQMKLRDETRKTSLRSLQKTLREYLRINGSYPVAKTEDKIFRGREGVSSLYANLRSLPSISYTFVPGDPKEGFYYGYSSTDGTSYALTAQLEYWQESDCDRSLSQDICMYALHP